MNDEISKLKEQMKFFQLELINRDKNYNEIFNYNPMVGMLDSQASTKMPTISNLSSKENATSNQVLPSQSKFPSFNTKPITSVDKNRGSITSVPSKFKM